MVSYTCVASFTHKLGSEDSNNHKHTAEILMHTFTDEIKCHPWTRMHSRCRMTRKEDWVLSQSKEIEEIDLKIVLNVQQKLI